MATVQLYRIIMLIFVIHCFYIIKLLLNTLSLLNIRFIYTFIIAIIIIIVIIVIIIVIIIILLLMFYHIPSITIHYYHCRLLPHPFLDPYITHPEIYTIM